MGELVIGVGGFLTEKDMEKIMVQVAISLMISITPTVASAEFSLGKWTAFAMERSDREGRWIEIE